MNRDRFGWRMSTSTRSPYFEPTHYVDVGIVRTVVDRRGRMVHPTTADQSRPPVAKTIKVDDEGIKRNDAIFYILKPVLFFSKYIGIFPLSGVYECPTFNRFWRQILLDKVIPICGIIWLIFTGYVILKVLTSGDPLLTRRGVDYYSVLTTNLTNVTLSIIPAIAAYFRNDRMTNFLKMFSRVNNLLAELKSSSRFHITAVYAVILSLHICKSFCWVHLIGKIDAPDLISSETNTWGAFTPLVQSMFFIGIIFHSVGECHTPAIYFAFVYTIGNGFLTMKSMLKNLNEPPGIARSPHDDVVVAQKLRELRLKHVFLVQMGRRLDRLFSPVLFTTFVIEALITSVVLFQLINTKNHGSWIYTLAIFIYGLAGFCAMMLVCAAADNTTKAGNSIAAVIFSSDLTANPACQNEINLYALQLNVHQVQFNASGFFPINHSLAGTIIGIALTYSVVMIQLRGADSA